MTTLPREVLQRLADLPEGKPCRVVLNTNGQGEWKTEVTIFDGTCRQSECISLAELLAVTQED